MVEAETHQFKAALPPFGCPVDTVEEWRIAFLLYAPFEGLVDSSLPPPYRKELDVLKDVCEKHGWHIDPKSLSPECKQALLWLHCKLQDAMVLCSGRATNWKYTAPSDIQTAQQYCSKTGSPIFAACGKVAQAGGPAAEAYPLSGCRSFNKETGQSPPGAVIVYSGGHRGGPSLSIILTVALSIASFYSEHHG
ncbi:conserved hypothetical protein [Neospora caninum Liverpool]|uniref:Uncharacterized protein n=1 Tax=Neospora caninum (strain Liverpool) TaxID=572307 RepID=F0VQI3_NEOCL|nr:conserved hypothetical protein [Neospora caninum Liverpool]CBZ55980.1 conserved hypothetical protein [Neospora caninum Liverpool]CEL70726.1 TPA: hypothetical protein BN1204_064060 [Neospora caninum Liverpool]|eukprot:XP_003886006.1 conserved hypothetical protein [Neospora caninum Liverpool]